jgi:hypothetical protein
MGCSNPHPHGQAWSLSAVPSIPAQELRLLTQYALSTGQSSDAPKGAGGEFESEFRDNCYIPPDYWNEACTACCVNTRTLR